jgi:Tfp pilus assembly protein PilN
MANINFVPDDYVQNNESRRTNLMYLVLFLLVMVALGGSFMIIKVRQRALNAKEQLVDSKLSKAEEVIQQFEELQTKRKATMKAAAATAELLEPVPKTILLAALTNNLPSGVSLLRLNLVQKEPKDSIARRRAKPTSKYKSAQAGKSTANQPEIPRERLLETHIDIEGIAPSDLQLAAYIGHLRNSTLLDNVALVETKEEKIDDTPFRQFKLVAMLKKNVHLTAEDVTQIRTKGRNAVRVF